mmetsp:Transcript_14092/g.27363  ORF Transcript_14092/g.27363 Transcript_14092/m.27363 type:complete len:217 (+) Transcript_14092:423-1073(+)
MKDLTREPLVGARNVRIHSLDELSVGLNVAAGENLTVGGAKLVGVDVAGVLDAVGAVLEALDLVLLSEVTRGGPGAVGVHAELVVTEVDLVETRHTPVNTPRVADNPVLTASLLIGTPTDSLDNVVDLAGGVGKVEDTALVLGEHVGVDTAGNGSTGVDLALDGLSVGEGAVLSYSGVGEDIDLRAEAAVVLKGRAGAADVDGLAGVVAKLAVTLL